MDNTITYNSAYYGGGISFDRYTSSVIKGNNINGNSAVQGGGISCTVFSSPSIINNTIFGNAAFTNGGGISPKTHFYGKWLPKPMLNAVLEQHSRLWAENGGI